MRFVQTALALLVVAGCSSKPSGSIQLVFGQLADGGRADPLSTPPVPVRLAVTMRASDAPDAGTITLATTSLPASSIDLGNFDQTRIGAIAVAGYDKTDARVVLGTTLPVELGALQGVTLPLFVQRTGAMAIMPSTLPDSRQSPILGSFDGQFLLVAGADRSVALYDFAGYSAAPGPTLPLVPQSVALPPCRGGAAGSVCLVGWFIGQNTPGQYAGYYVDFSSGKSTAIALPPGGGGFADIAGGATVLSSAGAMYIVGGTAESGLSKWVLAIDPYNVTDSAYPYGYPTWLKLAQPRQGAAALWVDGDGLLVVGGSETAPGFEIVAGSSVACTPPPVPTSGAAAAVLADGRLLVAGGLAKGQGAGVSVIDLSACTVTPWASLPVALANAQIFVVGPTDALVVGDEPSGPTHVFRVTLGQSTEVSTMVPHAKARALFSPASALDPGSFVLFGGANVLESFAP